jgi:KDO2-lipid IV(A) lauroyltransferase
MTIIENFIFNILKNLLYLVGKIPPETGWAISQKLGRLWFRLDKKHRLIVKTNLKMAYREKLNSRERMALAQKVFENTVKMFFEFAWFHHIDPKHFSDYIRVQGLDHLISAHAREKGVLVLTGHMGNWELVTALAYMTGLPSSVVYRRIEFEPLEQLIKQYRERIGINLFQLHNALDGVSKALARRDLVGLLMDQNTGHSRGVFVDFFDIEACSNPGLAKLALSTGAPVVPVFSYRIQDHFVIEIQPELSLIRTGNLEKDIIANTQEQNRIIEKMVRRFPDQWFWFHRRWKTRPLPEEKTRPQSGF